MTLNDDLSEAIGTYVDSVRKELHTKWEGWKFDPSRAEVHEVTGALMGRQVSIATQIARSPSIWNGHIAPVLLRTMVDVYVTFAWILKDPLDRSRKYVLYGLGQEKLYLENLKVNLAEKGSEEHPVVDAMESWINSQRYTFLTDVNVGSWSGLSTRAMAQEADCMDIYRYAYSPFSSSAHSTWNHVAKYNLQPCDSVLHRYHMVPVDSEMPPDPDYLYRTAKYVDKTFTLFDKTFNIPPSDRSSFAQLTADLDRLFAQHENNDEGSED
jgi:hypothetical protein